MTRFDIEKKAVLALVAPFEEGCEEGTLVGGETLEGGVAGCRGKTMGPPPAGKILEGGTGRERSIIQTEKND